MADLAVLIPARNEKYLKPTVEDLLRNRRANTEIIVVADGQWPTEPLDQHPDVHLFNPGEAIGQRAATNEAARLTSARYVMKADAHCAFGEGYDVELIRAAEELGPNVVQIPRQHHLHVYNWRCDKCGEETIQGLRPALCPKCSHSAMSEIRIWERRGKRRGRKSTEPASGNYIYSDAWRFDSTLHFQYFPEWEAKHPTGDFIETMSFLGACFFCSREYFWALGGFDEGHGSWGNYATEWAAKAWLSGGRVITNRRTWYAHFFRVGGIGFPYPLSGAQVDHAREYSRSIWLNNAWPQQIHPLSLLLEKFAPVPGWTQKDLDALPKELHGRRSGAIEEDAAGNALHHEGHRAAATERRVVHRDVGTRETVTKGCIWYSDCRPSPEILRASQRSVKASGLPIVAVTLKPIDWMCARSIVLPLERGYLTMFRQILAGLEALDTDVVFFCEHDVIYSREHFAFTPSRADTFYYNQHVYKVDVESGKALHYLCSQTSGLCCNRQLAITHYRGRVARVEREGFSRTMGFEPGTRKIRHGGVDDTRSDTWLSTLPNVDLRHRLNLTPSRWKKEDFRNQKYTAGWTESDSVPGFGVTRGRMPELLQALAHPRPDPEPLPHALLVAAQADQAANRVGLQDLVVDGAAVGGHL